MNTTELKKLAEEAGKEAWAFGSFARGEIRIGPAENLKHAYFATMLAEGELPWDKTESSKDAFSKAAYIAAANPSTILKLLDINAELVEALKVSNAHVVELCTVFGIPLPDASIEKTSAALAKAEGNEL